MVFKDANLPRGKEIRHMRKKMDNYIYTTILFIFIMVTTHQRFRIKVYNIKQEEPEAKSTKAYQNKENRNTRTRKQWKLRATRKQKIKWL